MLFLSHIEAFPDQCFAQAINKSADMYILPCLLILDLCFLAVQGTVSVVTLCNWVFTRCIHEICAGCQSSVGQSNAGRG